MSAAACWDSMTPADRETTLRDLDAEHESGNRIPCHLLANLPFNSLSRVITDLLYRSYNALGFSTAAQRANARGMARIGVHYSSRVAF